MTHTGSKIKFYIGYRNDVNLIVVISLRYFTSFIEQPMYNFGNLRKKKLIGPLVATWSTP